MERFVYEYCPHCENEVILSVDMEPQQCPECGKWICPCAMCENCKKPCDLEEQCNKLNGE